MPLLAVPTLPGSLEQSDTTQDTPWKGSEVSRMEGKVGAGQLLQDGVSGHSLSCWTPVQHTHPGEDGGPGQALPRGTFLRPRLSHRACALWSRTEPQPCAFLPPPASRVGLSSLPGHSSTTARHRLPRNCSSCQPWLLGFGPEQIPAPRGSTEGPLSQLLGAGEMLVWDELQGITSPRGTNMLPTPLPQDRHIPTQGSPPPSWSLCFPAPEHSRHRAERPSGSDWEL